MTNDAPNGKKEFPLLYLLLFTAILAPIYGGYLLMDGNSSGPGFSGLIGSLFSSGMDVPVLTHALIAAPILLCIVFVLSRRRIQQTPNTIFTVCWMIFFGLLGITAMASNFRLMSLTLWFEWLVYGAVLFATVAVVGRKTGPVLVMTALGTGSALVAVRGILEYSSERPGNPTWRIFAGWMNPNATAAMLLIGFFVCLGLCLSRNRLEALAAGAAVVLIGFALSLTGSKGAFSLALPLGMLALGFLLMRRRPSLRPLLFGLAALLGVLCTVLFYKNIGIAGSAIAALYAIGVCYTVGDPAVGKMSGQRLLACFGALLALILLLSVAPAPNTATNSPSVAGSPMRRIMQGGSETSEQSAVFRMNLWKSAVDLSLSRPFTGYGLGSYRYESARPGLITSTVFAHQVYLQIWAESGLVTLVAFLAGIGMWFWQVLKSVGKIPAANLAPIAGVVSAVTAILAHSLVDSDLYYFGIGVVFFMLMGIGLLLSADAVAPEYVPKGARLAGSLGAIFLGILMLGAADIDDVKAMARYDLSQRDRVAFLADIDAMSWFSSFDGEAQYLLASAKEGHDRLAALQMAYALSPTNKFGRALAVAQSESGDAREATATLLMTLERDPNSMLALKELVKLQQQQGENEAAVKSAQRLVSVEKTPYFMVRSIPESVPTETYQTRFEILAPAAKSDRERADILAEGVKGMLSYERVTARIIQQNAISAKDVDLREPGYDSLNEAVVKLKEATKAAKDAADVYRREGDAADLAEMERDGDELTRAMADLGGSK